MKQTDGYILHEIAGIPYLLPHGQLIADHRRGVQLNETGVFLWNTLEHVHNREELLSLFFEHYQAGPDDIPGMEQDFNDFLDQLSSYGIIEEDFSPFSPDAPFYQYLCIGGLYLELAGPAEAFSEEFEPFAVSHCSKTDMTVEVCTGIPANRKNGTLILRSSELLICDCGDDYLLLFPKAEQIQEAWLAKDSSHVSFCCLPPFSGNLITDLFHAIRFVYLYLAQRKGLFALHSASILYQNRAWLFSGPSGTGKSTHTNLWNRLLQTPVINGDLNLLSLTPDGPVVYGMPWCGTSGIADPGTYPLGGIVLLKQAGKDTCISLSEDKKALLVMQRLISPSWTKEMLLSNLSFTETLAKETRICRFLCTKEPSAVYTIKEWIDRI